MHSEHIPGYVERPSPKDLKSSLWCGTDNSKDSRRGLVPVDGGRSATLTPISIHCYISHPFYGLGMAL